MSEREPVPVDPIRVEKPSVPATEDLSQLSAQYGDGRLLKMEVDYAPQVDEALPKADALAKAGKVTEAVDSLAQLEKLTRLGLDMKSNSRIVRHMVKLAFEGKNWDLLNETIVTLSKKRSIIKFAIKNMIQDCCEMVDQLPTETERNRLVETLRTVTAGKIYVEVERARLTKRLVTKLEAEKKLEEAWTMIMELQVETYGSMEIKEKVQFLLHQIRLCIERKDFLRAAIISRKISTKFFDSKSDDVQDLKLEYYHYMITIGLHDGNYLDVCRYYRAIFETPKIQADKGRASEVLKCVVLYVLLTPHGNEQWDLVHRIHSTRQLELIPQYNALLEL
ncbi:PCI domain-containing protein, partial [Aphelenchoides avenae]